MVSFQLVASAALVGFLLAALLLWYFGRKSAYERPDGVVAPAQVAHARVAHARVADGVAATAQVAHAEFAAAQVAQRPPSSCVAVSVAVPSNGPAGSQASVSTSSWHGLGFQLADAQSGRLIWTYAREGVALGFVRDVVRLRSHREAAQFELRLVDGGARTTTLARGEQLVRLALEDRVL